ncbi:MAG: hypothetical protein ABI444_09280 [Candidatus Kapaibacterium sp.]
MIAIFTCLALVFSSVGVTVVSVACAKPQARQTVICPMCKKSAPPLQQKNTPACCKQISKHLSLHAEFERTQQTHVAPAVHVALFAAITALELSGFDSDLRFDVASSYRSDTFNASSSQEQCALVSNFRI